MSARSRMTMRAAITRNSTVTANDWNQADTPVFDQWTTEPCWAWVTAKREVIDGDKVVVVEDIRALFPLSANLTDQDRIAHISDRADTVIFDGPFVIESIQRMTRHLELVLSRVS